MNTPSEKNVTPQGSAPLFTRIEPQVTQTPLSPIPKQDAVTTRPPAAKGDDDVMSQPAKQS